ncbi:MAG: hypothetical protein LBB73_06295 [Dysgonamonadaceae bacterium]|nr:hypothetical protein [Dysgonamonadaceae bacterium]
MKFVLAGAKVRRSFDNYKLWPDLGDNSNCRALSLAPPNVVSRAGGNDRASQPHCDKWEIT